MLADEGTSRVQAVADAVGQLTSTGWQPVQPVTGEPPQPVLLTKDGVGKVIVTNSDQQGQAGVAYSVQVTS